MQIRGRTRAAESNKLSLIGIEQEAVSFQHQAESNKGRSEENDVICAGNRTSSSQHPIRKDSTSTNPLRNRNFVRSQDTKVWK